MKYTHSPILLFLFALSFPLNAQLFPDPPKIYRVTVDPETQYDIITWYHSADTITDHYYILESEYKGGGNGGTPISGIIMKPDSSFIYPNTSSGLRSVGYYVVAVNDKVYDTFTTQSVNADSTIFLSGDYDACNASIMLTWNRYSSWSGSISEYILYRRLGPNNYIELQSFPPGDSQTLTYMLPVQANQTYDLFIKAVHIDGRTSTSNRDTTATTWQASVPDFINADYATLGPENSIDVSFTVDSLAGVKRYYLLRSDNQNGNYAIIDSFETDNANIFYNDEINFTSGVFYYKLQAANSCNSATTLSNNANNIILKGNLRDMHVNLLWNEYLDWNGDVSEYQVIRTIGKDDPIIDTIAELGDGTAFYSDDVSSLVNYENPLPSRMCYTLQAIENQNMYGIQGKSISNTICFSINSEIRIPNAIIPNDTDPVNREFSPVFAFLPHRYEINIYNRLGGKIWEGTGPWDGTTDGKYVPEGVYVYFIRVFNGNSSIQEYQGSLTVLYR